jgi:tetratricopeptide (TPR) repeat protein
MYLFLLFFAISGYLMADIGNTKLNTILEKLYKNEKWEMLHKYVKEGLEKEPKSYLLNLYMARYFFHQKDYKKAIKYYEKAIIVSNGKLALPFSELASLYYEKKDYKSSLRVSKKCLLRDEKNYSCLLTLLKTYYKRKEFDKALETIKFMLSHYDNRSEVYLYLGLIYLNKGDVERAITSFKQGIAIKPDDAVFYYNLGVCYEKLKEYEMAFIMYDKALRIYPNSMLIMDARNSLKEKIFSLP